jgi:hypothetical protein
MMKRGTETVMGISMFLHIDTILEGRGEVVTATARIKVRRRVRMVAIGEFVPSG